jgi:hypothetical protein
LDVKGSVTMTATRTPSIVEPINPGDPRWRAKYEARYGALPAARSHRAGLTWGERFVLDRYRGDVENKRHTRVPVGELRERAVITSATAPANATPAVTATPGAGRLLDLVGHGATDSDRVPLVTVTSSGTLPPTAEGAAKPEAPLTFGADEIIVETFAAWLDVTRNALDNDGWLAGIIDGVLTAQLLRSLEADIAATIATTPALPAASIAAGINAVQAAGYTPNALLGNPADLAALDPLDLGAYSQVWGITPVANAAVTAGTLFVGDFAAGVTVWERSGVDVFTADQHGDHFIANVVTVLAELRAATGITAPDALAAVTATP